MFVLFAQVDPDRCLVLGLLSLTLWNVAAARGHWGVGRCLRLFLCLWSWPLPMARKMRGKACWISTICSNDSWLFKRNPMKPLDVIQKSRDLKCTISVGNDFLFERWHRDKSIWANLAEFNSWRARFAARVPAAQAAIAWHSCQVSGLWRIANWSTPDQVAPFLPGVRIAGICKLRSCFPFWDAQSHHTSKEGWLKGMLQISSCEAEVENVKATKEIPPTAQGLRWW